MPDVGSVPAYDTTRRWLYQPLKSAARSGVPAVTEGGVASKRSPNEALAVFPALSRHVPATDADPLSGPE